METCCTLQDQVSGRSKVVPFLDHGGRHRKDINGDKVLGEAGRLRHLLSCLSFDGYLEEVVET